MGLSPPATRSPQHPTNPSFFKLSRITGIYLCDYLLSASPYYNVMSLKAKSILVTNISLALSTQ